MRIKLSVDRRIPEMPLLLDDRDDPDPFDRRDPELALLLDVRDDIFTIQTNKLYSIGSIKMALNSRMDSVAIYKMFVY